MVTFLIISKDQTVRESHALTKANEQNIHPLDISSLETEGSIGIEDIRNFQKQIILKPLKGKHKAAVIKNAHRLTIEAQNALLKTLEEPPDNTYIFLTAETIDTFLSTILSRTSVITLDEVKQWDQKELQTVEEQITSLSTAPIGAKLKFAEAFAADKSKAISWIETATYVLRNHMLSDITGAQNFVPQIESFQKAYKAIKTTNVNLRFTLETLFLKI